MSRYMQYINPRNINTNQSKTIVLDSGQDVPAIGSPNELKQTEKIMIENF